VQLVTAAPNLGSFARVFDPEQGDALAVSPETSVSNSMVSSHAAGGPLRFLVKCAGVKHGQCWALLALDKIVGH
jgi:hypothetical protein